MSIIPPPGVTNNVQANWTMPVGAIRCDNQVGNRPGCVFPSNSPTLELSLSVYRGGAMNILVGQSLPDGWGKTVPLHREANPTVQASNRRKTCGDFERLPDVVPNDSCDEFPFAATKEGGKQGYSCASIRPYQQGGQWTFEYYKRPNGGSEPCVIGHVPLAENTLVGSALGNFTQSQRLLDNDAYYVSVVP